MLSTALPVFGLLQTVAAARSAGGNLWLRAAAQRTVSTSHASPAAQPSASTPSHSSPGGGASHSGGASSSQGGGELHVVVEPLADELEGVSVISLNRPRAKNAFGRQLMRELVEAINNLRQERSTRCVIVRSTVPGVFCAGADLKERAVMTQAEVAEWVSATRRILGELEALPMPTVAAIDGLALGGGAELALACDIRVASEGAVLAFPEAQLGIIPGAGGTQRLARLVGPARAKELIFTGRRVGAAEAERIGLVNHVARAAKHHAPPSGAEDTGAGGSPSTPAPLAYDRALELAKDIARCAPMALRMGKVAVGLGLNMDMASGLRVEEACYAQLIPTQDRLEGLKAFAEKRKPQFKGE